MRDETRECFNYILSRCSPMGLEVCSIFLNCLFGVSG